MNRVEIIELVQQHHPHMGETEIIKLINRALDDFTINTESLKKYENVGNTVAGQRYYGTATTGLTKDSINYDSDIIRILNVWVDDVLIPRMASVNAAMFIDDDEHAGNDNELAAPSKISNERYWYPIQDVYGLKLGLIEKSVGTVKRDDKISDYQSISETGLQIRLHYISRANHLVAGSTTSFQYIPEIHSAWHPALVSKAIAEGYKDPRNQKFDAVQFFIGEYEDYIKQAKKEARSSGITTGVIVPHSF